MHGGYREGSGRKKGRIKEETVVIRVRLSRWFVCKSISSLGDSELEQVRNLINNLQELKNEQI